MSSEPPHQVVVTRGHRSVGQMPRLERPCESNGGEAGPKPPRSPPLPRPQQGAAQANTGRGHPFPEGAEPPEDGSPCHSGLSTTGLVNVARAQGRQARGQHPPVPSDHQLGVGV